MSNIESNQLMLDKLYDGNIKTDLSGDYILPDYLNDIKSILRTAAYPKISGHYINMDTLDYDGEFVYSILFMSEDGSIKNVVFNAPYEGSIKIDGLSGNVTNEPVVVITPTVENISYRLVNPRKVNVKCKCASQIDIYTKKEIAPAIEGRRSIEDEFTLERDTAVINTMDITAAEESDIRLSEDIELESTLPQIKEVAACLANIYIYECKALQNKAQLKGDCIVNIIYQSIDDSYMSILRKIPVSQTVEIDNLSDKAECVANAYIDTVKCEAAKNSYEENRILETDINFNVVIQCLENIPVELTRDAYSTVYNCSVDYENIAARTLNRVYNTNFSLNLSNPNENGTAGVLDTSAVASVTNIRIGDNNRPLVEGTVDVTMVLTGSEGEITSLTFTSPFKYEASIEIPQNDFDCTCDTYIINIKGRASDMLYTDIEVALNMLFISKSNEKTVKTVNLERNSPISRTGDPSIVLYYPEAGERIWDVAKKYRISSERLRNENTDNPNGKVLVIPCVKSTGYEVMI